MPKRPNPFNSGDMDDIINNLKGDDPSKVEKGEWTVDSKKAADDTVNLDRRKFCKLLGALAAIAGAEVIGCGRAIGYDPEGCDSGVEGCHVGPEGCDSGVEGCDAGPEGCDSGVEGCDAGPEGCEPEGCNPEGCRYFA